LVDYVHTYIIHSHLHKRTILITYMCVCVCTCAGLYIPMLSDRLLNNSHEATQHGAGSLQGFMIGNGCPGWNVLTCTPYSCGHTGGICSGGGTEVAVSFRFGHALASQPTFANYRALCGDQRWDDPSPGCIDAINRFTAETGTGGLAGSTYNIYDMWYVLTTPSRCLTRHFGPALSYTQQV
jgi:hypothetical protein